MKCGKDKPKLKPDQMWTAEFSQKARSEGWDLFQVAVSRCEIMKWDGHTPFKSDAEAVYHVYQQALRHEDHARAALTISLYSTKKEY